MLRCGIVNVAPASNVPSASAEPPVSMTTSHASAYSSGGSVTVAAPSALK